MIAFVFLGLGVKVHLVQLAEEIVQAPFVLRVYPHQTVAALKDQVASHLSCDADKICCVLDIRTELRLLSEPERSLTLVGFGKNNKVSFCFPLFFKARISLYTVFMLVQRL